MNTPKSKCNAWHLLALVCFVGATPLLVAQTRTSNTSASSNGAITPPPNPSVDPASPVNKPVPNNLKPSNANTATPPPLPPSTVK